MSVNTKRGAAQLLPLLVLTYTYSLQRTVYDAAQITMSSAAESIEMFRAAEGFIDVLLY